MRISLAQTLSPPKCNETSYSFCAISECACSLESGLASARTRPNEKRRRRISLMKALAVNRYSPSPLDSRGACLGGAGERPWPTRRPVARRGLVAAAGGAQYAAVAGVEALPQRLARRLRRGTANFVFESIVALVTETWPSSGDAGPYAPDPRPNLANCPKTSHFRVKLIRHDAGTCRNSPSSSQIWPALGQTRPNLELHRPKSTRRGRDSAKLGPIPIASDQDWSSSDLRRSMLGQDSAKSGGVANSANFERYRPGFARSWPVLTRNGPTWSNLDQVLPKLFFFFATLLAGQGLRVLGSEGRRVAESWDFGVLGS